jgi:hypothetical protein
MGCLGRARGEDGPDNLEQIIENTRGVDGNNLLDCLWVVFLVVLNQFNPNWDA